MFNNIKYNTNTIYNKPTFVKVLDTITPRLYVNDDYNLSSTTTSPETDLINSHLILANNISSVFPINNLPGTIYSSINSLEGISRFFVKQNELSKITPLEFERNILLKFGTSFKNFTTSSEFGDYLDSTLLSSTYLNSPTDFLGVGSTSANHLYLIENLSWLYFLNQSGTDGSSIVKNILVENTYRGNRIDLNDCLRGVEEFIWSGISTNPTWVSFIPTKLRPESYLTVSNAYTSGTQQLDKLKTFVDIVYSPYVVDLNDFTVKDAFEDYINNSFLLDTRENAGPFWRLLKAYSYSMFDVYNQIDGIRTLNDIDSCPDEYLPYLAELIGWPLFGAEPDRWRLQLTNAVDVYKKCGTKESIQFALNSIFSEDVFNIYASISELWESYIPHLIYYSLATESIHLSSMDSWTVSKANSLGVVGFSTSSLDENIRLATDAIIYSVVQNYRDYFKYGKKSFPTSDDFIFNYRGRNYPIPPWEEYPYYINTDISEEQIDFIADKLVCFGVRNDFAIEVSEFIKNNTIRADDDIRLHNKWLFFTSGYNQPSNFGNIIINSTSKNTDYLTLWSGKSSHYNATLEAGDFNFSNDTLNSNSRETLKIAGQVLNEFSPAHSIPNLSLKLSALDDYIVYEVNQVLIDLQKIDSSKSIKSGLKDPMGYEVSGINYPLWKRGSQTGNTPLRTDIQTLNANSILAGSGVIQYPRTNQRRRNLKYLLPKNGYYSMDGFNNPNSWEPSSPKSVFYPLGFIPSALKYETNPSADVYSYCQNYNSTSVFYGVAVSDTFPMMGWNTLNSNAKMPEISSEADLYVDMGQLPDIYWVIFKCLEGRNYWNAYLQVSANYDTYASSLYWKDEIQSLANQEQTFSSVNDFYNFEFGRDIHRLYRNYIEYFEAQSPSKYLFDYDGPNIFAHTYGSVIRNSKFDKNGSGTSFITNNLSSIQILNVSSPVFASASSGRITASSTSSIYAGRYEFRNPTIISGLELVITSGTSPDNYFIVFNLDASGRRLTQSEYMFDKTFIVQKAVNGLPRLRYDIGHYPCPSDESQIITNFLVPEHKFRFSISGLASNDIGTMLGGVGLGIWIHTKDEGGYCWSYTKDNIWVRHSSDLTKEEIISQYIHKKLFTNKTREDTDVSGNKSKKFICLEAPTASSLRPPVLTSFTEDEFDSFDIEFNTCNNYISVPNSYYEYYQQVHRKDQDYIFEVFAIPSEQNRDKFVLFDKINLIDLTLNKWSQYLATGTSSTIPMKKYCEEFRVPLEKDELRSIIVFFLDCANGLAHRKVISSSDDFSTSGGSRLNYREHPTWAGITI